MPLASPQELRDAFLLAPAQRIDLIIDVIAEDGETAGLLTQDPNGDWVALVEVAVRGQASVAQRDAPQALPANNRMAVPDFAAAPLREMKLEGGAMRGMMSGRYMGRDHDFRGLMQRGQFWALSGQVGLGDTPFQTYDRGETARIRFVNETVFPHAMHLHGMHFHVLTADGQVGPMRDTVLVAPGESTEITFLADNPGKWLLHCHMLGHAASGMTNWIHVA